MRIHVLQLQETLPSHRYYFNSILNADKTIKDTIWYKFSRSYNYGVRILGPTAQIEKTTGRNCY